jgi:hypothetical protein
VIGWTPVVVQVTCGHAGCEWKGEYSDLSHHESSCAAGRPWPCPGCGAALPAPERGAHAVECLPPRLRALERERASWGAERAAWAAERAGWEARERVWREEAERVKAGFEAELGKLLEELDQVSCRRSDLNFVPAERASRRVVCDPKVLCRLGQFALCACRQVAGRGDGSVCPWALRPLAAGSRSRLLLHRCRRMAFEQRG